MPKPKILISSPNTYNDYTYLPLVWGILKTRAEARPSIQNSFEWLDPIFENRPAQILLSKYDGQTIDVLGLSCYVWNYDLNLKIARQVKSINPRCLVVAGGPHIDWKDTKFFESHPEVDVVVKGEGEDTFADILEEFAVGRRDFSKIAGIFISPVMNVTSERQRRTDFRESPWIAQSGYFSGAISDMRKREGMTSAMIWQTDVGCPYGCTFCDWGSATMTKVRRFPIERVTAEIQWIGESGVEEIEIANANFGMFSEDVTTATGLAESSRRFGFPKRVYVNSAKNNGEHVARIGEILYEANLTDQQPIALQTLDPKTLAAVKRTNLPARELNHLIGRLKAKNVPMLSQLIRAQPGDTYDGWLSSLAQVSQLGVLDHQVFPLLLLPNAPASQPDYRKKFGIETILRYSSVKRRSLANPLGVSSLVEVCIGSKTFDSSEAMSMWMLSVWTNILLNGGLGRFWMQFLWRTHGIPFESMFREIEVFFRTSDEAVVARSQLRITENMERFLDSRVAPEDVFEEFCANDYPELSDYAHMLDAEEFLLYSFTRNFEQFWQHFSAFVILRFGDNIEALRSVLDFNKEMIITPSYDCESGKLFETDRDWVQYFVRCAERPAAERIDSPLVGRFLASVKDTHCGVRKDNSLDWGKLTENARLFAFFKSTIGSEYSRIRRSYFQDVSLTKLN